MDALLAATVRSGHAGGDRGVNRVQVVGLGAGEAPLQLGREIGLVD